MIMRRCKVANKAKLILGFNTLTNIRDIKIGLNNLIIHTIKTF